MVKYKDNPFGKNVKVAETIKDFLPPPEKLKRKPVIKLNKAALEDAVRAGLKSLGQSDEVDFKALFEKVIIAYLENLDEVAFENLTRLEMTHKYFFECQRNLLLTNEVEQLRNAKESKEQEAP